MTVHVTTAKCMVEKQLLEAPMTVCANVQDGVTPLMAAAEEGHKSAAELLLSRGASVTWTNKVTIGS